MALIPTASASSMIVIFGLRSRVWRILSFVLFMGGSIHAQNKIVNILDKYHKNPKLLCCYSTVGASERCQAISSQSLAGLTKLLNSSPVSSPDLLNAS